MLICKNDLIKGGDIMDDLTIITNSDFNLKSGNSLVLYNHDSSNLALISCKRSRTHITLIDDVDDVQSTVISALRDEELPSFSIDTDILNAIIDHSSVIIDDLITLLAYRQDIGQKTLDNLMQKICNLSQVYASEYIISEINKMPTEDFEAFINSEDTYIFFKEYVDTSE